MSGTPTAREREKAAVWLEEAFQPGASFQPTRFPISFRYDGQESAVCLSGWRAEWAPAVREPGSTRHRLSLTDPKTGLECRVEITAFDDFPAVEWVAYFKNTSGTDTPILADIQPLDALFAGSREDACWVHHAKGSQAQWDDFQPQKRELRPGNDLRLAPLAGRSSDGVLPFFNLELGEGGIIGAIGWTGGWAATFRRQGEGPGDGRLPVRTRAGMIQTHLKLLPGEEIRTPRILLLFWEGERLHGHNMLRSFLLAHHTPRPNGELLLGPISDAHWGDRKAEHQIAKARWLRENDLPVEYFWIDADWYGDLPHDEASDTFGRAWQVQVGNWYPRKSVYPEGLKPVGDALKALGLGFILWVDAERVYEGTQIAREHPEWLLGPINHNYVFNLGIPEARQYLTDLISSLITESGVTGYRQDFNTAPAPFWQAADAPDRIGITEIHHIEGLYAYWDALLARHPGLIIDNCCGGGRRIDLEMISRSIPLWRSDLQCYPNYPPASMQGQTHGLGLWVPLSGGHAGHPGNTYSFRSGFSPAMVFGWSEAGLAQGAEFPVEWCRRMLADLRAVRPYFYGDFYPLMEFSLAEDAWAVWQFDRPDLGEGMVLAFRRAGSPHESGRFKLRGLTPDARYAVIDRDGAGTTEAAGQELAQQGLQIAIEEQPGTRLLTYRRLGRQA